MQIFVTFTFLSITSIQYFNGEVKRTAVTINVARDQLKAINR